MNEWLAKMKAAWNFDKLKAHAITMPEGSELTDGACAMVKLMEQLETATVFFQVINGVKLEAQIKLPELSEEKLAKN